MESRGQPKIKSAPMVSFAEEAKSLLQDEYIAIHACYFKKSTNDIYILYKKTDRSNIKDLMEIPNFISFRCLGNITLNLAHKVFVEDGPSEEIIFRTLHNDIYCFYHCD